MAYEGRLAIIAGGLGGLGSETAKLLHASGASLALLYAPFEADRKDKLLATAFGTPTPSNIKAYEADITDEGSVARAFAAIAAELTSQSPSPFPSILVNAAGYVSVQPLTETSAAEAAKNILPNLLGPFIVSNAFYNLYTSTSAPSSPGNKPPGRIVSISSQAAHVALPNHGAYCASKAGLLGLVRSQALEWGPEGITSNSVSPTVAMTELGRKAWADPEKRDDMLRQIPTGRFAEPDEIARAMEWLCRDGNGMVNGADLRIDGGEFSLEFWPVWIEIVASVLTRLVLQVSRFDDNFKLRLQVVLDWQIFYAMALIFGDMAERNDAQSEEIGLPWILRLKRSRS